MDYHELTDKHIRKCFVLKRQCPLKCYRLILSSDDPLNHYSVCSNENIQTLFFVLGAFGATTNYFLGAFGAASFFCGAFSAATIIFLGAFGAGARAQKTKNKGPKTKFKI